MTRLSLIPLLTFILLLLAGCNNDIFVEPLPSITHDVTMDGDNGSYTFPFRAKGLLNVYLDNSLAEPTYTQYFTAKNELTYPDVFTDDIAKIRYVSPRFTFEILREGDTFTLRAVDNTYPHDIGITLGLNYGYTSDQLDITVTPGPPMDITTLGYTENPYPIVSRITEKRSPEHFTNSTDSPVRIAVHPFQGEKTRMSLTTDDSWAAGVAGRVVVPYYSAGYWHISTSHQMDVTLGETVDFDSSWTDTDTAGYIDVSPQATVSYTVTTVYACIEACFVASLTQPNSGETMITWGKCTVTQPMDFTIDIL